MQSSSLSRRVVQEALCPIFVSQLVQKLQSKKWRCRKFCELDHIFGPKSGTSVNLRIAFPERFRIFREFPIFSRFQNTHTYYQFCAPTRQKVPKIGKKHPKFDTFTSLLRHSHALSGSDYRHSVENHFAKILSSSTLPIPLTVFEIFPKNLFLQPGPCKVFPDYSQEADCRFTPDFVCTYGPCAGFMNLNSISRSHTPNTNYLKISFPPFPAMIIYIAT